MPSAPAQHRRRRVSVVSATARRPRASRSSSAASMTQIPGVDFTTVGKIAKAYFNCVNDNGGINGRPDPVHDRTPSSSTRRSSCSLAKKLDRERQGRRHRRQHEPHRVPGQHDKYYKQQGLLRHRRRRAGRVLQLAELRRREHGPALQRTSVPRRRSLKRARSRLVVSSPARGGRRTPTAAPCYRREGGRRSVQGLRREPAADRHRTRSSRSSCRRQAPAAACAQLHPRDGHAAPQGGGHSSA